MNKKTILGLLTGAAIVAATTGSYAAWDQLEATANTKTISIRKPIVVSAIMSDPTETEKVGEIPTYSANVTVKATDIPENTETELSISPTITKTDGTDVSNQVEVTINDVDPSTNKIAMPDNGEININVKVTPKEENSTALGGETLTVGLKATLSEKTATPAGN